MSDLIARRTLALAMALTPGVGGISIARTLARLDILGRSPDAFSVLSPEALQEEYGWKPSAAQGWVENMQERVTEARELEQRLDRHGVSILTAADATYPARIEAIDPNAPGVLFLYGNTKLIESKTFCVMSSRKSPPAALDLIEQLTEKGVLGGETLVSGHDTPEYQRSAVVPLRWGSPRILALDCGLFAALGDDLKQEPFRAARLWRYQFDPHTDLVISPVNPLAEGHKGSNAKRDRLIASLCLRLDFVLINEGGNMDKLARLGLRAKRQVRVSDLSLDYRVYAKLGASIIGN